MYIPTETERQDAIEFGVCWLLAFGDRYVTASEIVYGTPRLGMRLQRMGIGEFGFVLEATIRAVHPDVGATYCYKISERLVNLIAQHRLALIEEEEHENAEQLRRQAHEAQRHRTAQGQAR
jgi:hypothetical protein